MQYNHAKIQWVSLAIKRGEWLLHKMLILTEIVINFKITIKNVKTYPVSKQKQGGKKEIFSFCSFKILFCTLKYNNNINMGKFLVVNSFW